MLSKLKFRPATAVFSIVVLLFVGLLANASLAGTEIYRIAFVQLGDTTDLYFINSDGTGLMKIDEDVSSDFRWSPDRKFLAYSRGLGDSIEIYKTDTSGDTQRLTTFCESSGTGRYCYSPRWSPDGSQIVFQSVPNTGGWSNLYRMNADGSNLVKITNAEGRKRNFSLGEWSPKGDVITFQACGRNGNCRVGTMAPDGSSYKLLTPKRQSAYSPSFNARGGKIAYSFGYSHYDIYVMRSNGKNKKQVTHSKPGESDITWRPDGKISFVMLGPDYTQTLWIVNSDGSGEKKLQGGDNGRPDWRQGDGASVFTKVLDGKLKLVVGDSMTKNYTVIFTPDKPILNPSWGGLISE